MVSATTPNAPFTSQVCPRPTYNLHPRCLLSDAANSPSWLFLLRCHAPASLLCPRPEIPGSPCSLLPPTAPQSLVPKLCPLCFLKGLTRSSPSHPCCSALVWVSTPVSSLAGACPDPFGPSHVVQARPTSKSLKYFSGAAACFPGSVFQRNCLRSNLAQSWFTRGTQPKTRLVVCSSCTPKGESWGTHVWFFHSLPWIPGGVLGTSLPVPSGCYRKGSPSHCRCPRSRNPNAHSVWGCYLHFRSSCHRLLPVYVLLVLSLDKVLHLHSH